MHVDWRLFRSTLQKGKLSLSVADLDQCKELVLICVDVPLLSQRLSFDGVAGCWAVRHSLS